MKPRDNILTLLRQAKPDLQAKWPIGRIALFGSVARNEATEDSDVDILVDITGPMGLNFVTLALELEDLLQEKVDLVSSRGIKPALWPYIQDDLIDV